MRVVITEPLTHWLFEKYPEKFSLIMFGYMELFTEEMESEYLQWCKTEEGQKYLQ